MRTTHQEVSVDTLPVGATLDAPIYDSHGVLLLDEGIELTEPFIEGLRNRGLVQVHIGLPSRQATKSSSVRRASNALPVDKLLEDISRQLNKIGRRAKSDDQPRGGTYDPGAVKLVSEHIQQAAAEIDCVLADAEAGNVINIERVQETTAQTVIDVADDTDVAVHSALQFNPEDAAFRERLRTVSCQATVLSLAIGMRLRLDATQLLHLGMAATLSDIGLVQRPAATQVRALMDPASSEHIWLSHPQRGFEQLTAIKTVPGPVLQAIRQHHELIDGTGFPFHLADNRICLSARIIGMTQAFLALTSPLDGSEGFLPSDSVAYLIHHALEGRFCLRVMKAFVQATSIYPQGTMVQLADQRLATVLRCTGKDMMRPLIQVEGEACDLRYSPLRISQPIPSPTAKQRRLPVRMLQEILW